MKKAIVAVLILAVSTSAMADPPKTVATDSSQKLGEIIAHMEQSGDTDTGGADLLAALVKKEISPSDLDAYLVATVQPNAIEPLRKAIREQNFVHVGYVLAQSQRAAFAGSGGMCGSNGPVAGLVVGGLTVAIAAVLYAAIFGIGPNEYDRHQATSTAAYYNTQKSILDQLMADPNFGPNHIATQQQATLVRNALNNMNRAAGDLADMNHDYERGKKVFNAGLTVGAASLTLGLGCGIASQF